MTNRRWGLEFGIWDFLLEGRSHCEAEDLVLLRTEVVVEHALALRVPGVNQPERHVQYRHEEAQLDARRGLERARLADDFRGDARRVRQREVRGREGIDERRRRREDETRQVLFPRERLADVAHLAGVV